MKEIGNRYRLIVYDEAHHLPGTRPARERPRLPGPPAPRAQRHAPAGRRPRGHARRADRARGLRGGSGRGPRPDGRRLRRSSRVPIYLTEEEQAEFDRLSQSIRHYVATRRREEGAFDWAEMARRSRTDPEAREILRRWRRKTGHREPLRREAPGAGGHPSPAPRRALRGLHGLEPDGPRRVGAIPDPRADRSLRQARAQPRSRRLRAPASSWRWSACEVLNEGWDAPAVKVGVILGGEKGVREACSAWAGCSGSPGTVRPASTRSSCRRLPTSRGRDAGERPMLTAALRVYHWDRQTSSISSDRLEDEAVPSSSRPSPSTGRARPDAWPGPQRRPPGSGGVPAGSRRARREAPRRRRNLRVAVPSRSARTAGRCLRGERPAAHPLLEAATAARVAGRRLHAGPADHAAAVASLYADYPEFHRLAAFPTDYTAQALRADYDLAQAQALLYSATRVTVEAGREFKHILRYARLARLLYRVERVRGGAAARITTGPTGRPRRRARAVADTLSLRAGWSELRPAADARLRRRLRAVPGRAGPPRGLATPRRDRAAQGLAAARRSRSRRRTAWGKGWRPRRSSTRTWKRPSRVSSVTSARAGAWCGRARCSRRAGASLSPTSSSTTRTAPRWRWRSSATGLPST